jgi:hypothetical protein
MRKQKGKVDKGKLEKAKNKGNIDESGQNDDRNQEGKMMEIPETLSKKMVKSGMAGLKNPGAYCAFIYFIALPTHLRSDFIKGALTQGDFSKAIGINQATLSEWKAREGFWDDVKNVQKRFFQDSVGDIINAQKKEAMKGNPKSAKLFLEAIGFLEKGEKENEVPQMLAEAIKNITKVLDN